MKQNKNRHRNPRLREGRRVIHTPAGLFSLVAAVIALHTSRAVKASPVILRPCTPRSDTHCHAPTLAPPVSGGLLQLAECCHGTNRDKRAEPRGRDPARSSAGNGETRHHCPTGDRGPEHLPSCGARRLHADTEPPAHALQACTGCRIWTAGQTPGTEEYRQCLHCRPLTRAASGRRAGHFCCWPSGQANSTAKSSICCFHKQKSQ